MSQPVADADLILLCDAIKETLLRKDFTAPELAAAMPKTSNHRTLLRHLGALIERNQIYCIGTGRNKRYHLLAVR
ncbi:MAG: hypothetical protein ACHQ5A_11490, partial [Opitutales bacterium]